MAQNTREVCDLTPGGTPYVMGDTYVPRFWPPFFTLAGSSTIFLGYFFSPTNSKAIFWGTKTTNFYKNRSFWPQIQFFPRSFWVQFSAASGTPPSVFRPSTPVHGKKVTGKKVTGKKVTVLGRKKSNRKKSNRKESNSWQVGKKVTGKKVTFHLGSSMNKVTGKKVTVGKWEKK